MFEFEFPTGTTASGIHRPDFERMLGSICEGKVGAIFSIEASRLARTGRDWHTHWSSVASLVSC
jgi:DNA invertase Pin-like site-specific DNA recombinase